MPQGMGLLERDAQLTELDELMAGAASGRGGTAVVVASAGLGKTTLLRTAAERAGAHQLRVLTARGRELESDMAFGVARQLLEGAVAELDEDERGSVLAGAAGVAASLLDGGAAGSSADTAGVVHGLYWLAANLADRGPVLLVVDDAHWADAPSLRWLAYLAPRASSSPMLLLAASRPAGSRAPDSFIDALEGDEAVRRIGLDALGLDAVARLAGLRLGGSADPVFAEACHRATGGNPFYLAELLRAAEDDGLAPTADHAARVAELTTGDIARSILLRVGRLGEHADRVAGAVAVLAGDAEPRRVAALVDEPLDEVLRITDRLVSADVLRAGRPLEFIHPIARTAVYEEIGPGERSALHRRAAQVLADEGAAAERVAAHALAGAPAGDTQVLGWLRDAAVAAREAGAPEAAARYLRRALEEPPGRNEAAAIHLEIGRTLSGVDVAAAAASLAVASRATDPAVRRAALRWSGPALGFAARPREAVAALEAAVALAVDEEDALLLGSTRDFYAAGWTGDPDWAGRSARLQAQAADLVGATPGERRVLAVAAWDVARTGCAPSGRALELAGRVRAALATWLDADDGIETPAGIGESSIICDDPEALERHERAIAYAAARGMSANLASASIQTADIRLRRGRLVEAEADARTAWSLLAGEAEGAATFRWWAAATLLEVLVARGAVGEAAELAASSGLAEQAWEDLCTLPCTPLAPLALAGLRIAEGDLAGGADALRDAGTWLEDCGWANPALNPWRARLAFGLARAGRASEAREVVGPGLERARAFGAPWALGMALTAAGVAEQGERGRALLEEAIAVLEPAGCGAELARARIELGASLRRGNRRVEAREHLRAGLDLAHRCGAVPLVEQARAELAATGARPRRELLSGVEALTASERRVADLAAAGRTNREIAEALFVTRKTVETHLGHVFTKLGVSGRGELAATLSSAGA